MLNNRSSLAFPPIVNLAHGPNFGGVECLVFSHYMSRKLVLEVFWDLPPFSFLFFLIQLIAINDDVKKKKMYRSHHTGQIKFSSLSFFVVTYTKPIYVVDLLWSTLLYHPLLPPPILVPSQGTTGTSQRIEWQK